MNVTRNNRMTNRLMAFVTLFLCFSSLFAQDNNLIIEVDSAYASSLNELAKRCSFLGNYPEAIRLGTEAMEIRRKVLGIEHPDYAQSLSDIANYYARLGNYREAIRLATETVEIRKRVLGQENLSYANSLEDLSFYYAFIGDYSHAISLAIMANEILKRIGETNSVYYSNSLICLSRCYYYMGNYPEAVRLGTEALEILHEANSPMNLNYSTLINELSCYYSKLGNYSEAIVLCKEAIDINKTILGTEHPQYATSLNNLASDYCNLRNYSEAIRIGTEAMEIRKKVLGPLHPDYAISLNNLSTYYASIGNYIEAIKLAKEAKEIFKKVFGIDNADYAGIVKCLSNYYYALGNNDEAIQYGTEALEIRRKVLGSKHPEYAQSLNHLSCFQFDVGNYLEAIALCKEALDITKTTLGTECPEYSQYLINLSSYKTYLGQFDEAYELLVQSLHSSQRYFLNTFWGITSGQQSTLFARGLLDFAFNSYFPSIVFFYQNDTLISELFNLSALFAKGVLINTCVEMRKLILGSNDSILVSKYNDLVNNICIYDKQLEKPILERTVNMDSLRSVIDHQEMELARDSKAFGDFSHNLRITWRDVQEKLDSDDIAIEFLDFPVYRTDSVMYVALTLRNGYDAPRMITLFEGSQLDSIPEGSLYTDTSLYDLLWKPLESELSGAKDVYFSPSGDLHRIGIEYVPITPTENMCDRYTLHRLSSTRQLAVIRDGVEGEGGVLYGGLDYDAMPDKESAVTEGGDGTRSFRYVPRAYVDSLDLRGTLSYLPSTKEEAERIASDMKKCNMPCMSYTGKEGTEESFKQLDGTRLRVLHIATHGFYFTEEEADEKHFARPILQEDETSYQEDKPMTRSGLLLSGCRPALNHETIPDGAEDGILTAQEISELDLRGLDLVVLSACQTGLGDIVSGEGVFGLQRGFKSAGAKTIVMSLWKVDDNATLDLMVSFYGHYLKGKSKEEAFRLAREELRRKSQPGEMRPDWAAFVMLDGE